MSQSDFATSSGICRQTEAPPSGAPVCQEAHEDACRANPSLLNSSQMEPLQQEHLQQPPFQQLPCPQKDRPDHDQMLAGRLFAIVALCIICSIQDFFQIFNFSDLLYYESQTQEQGLIDVSMLATFRVLSLLAAWISGVVSIYMIIKKNKYFFLAFLISRVLSLVIVALVLIIAYCIAHNTLPLNSSTPNPLSTYEVILLVLRILKLLFFYAIVPFALGFYFVSSTQVHKYMGSKEYLRVIPFAKRKNRNHSDNV